MKPAPEPGGHGEAGIVELKETKQKKKNPKAAPLKKPAAEISIEDIALRA